MMGYSALIQKSFATVGLRRMCMNRKYRVAFFLMACVATQYTNPHAYNIISTATSAICQRLSHWNETTKECPLMERVPFSGPGEPQHMVVECKYIDFQRRL